jgi:hypothetical protein
MSMRLIALVAEVARLAAETIAKQMAKGELEPALLPALFEKAWAEMLRPTIEDLAARAELDVRALHDDPRYQALALQVIELGPRLKARGDQRRSERAFIELAAVIHATDLTGVLVVAAEQSEWMITGAAASSWRRLEGELLGALRGEGRLATDIAELQIRFCNKLVAELRGKVSPSAATLPGLRWERFGPPRPDLGALPDASFELDRTLCYDPGRGAIVYVPRRGLDTLGPLWTRHGDAWRVEPGTTLVLPPRPRKFRAKPYSQPSAVYDPGRGGLVVWILAAHDVFDATPVGMRFDGEPRVVEVGGPAVLSISRHTKVGFAFDPRRQVTVLVTGIAIWELDASGHWRCALERKRTDRSEEQVFGAVYDAAHQRIVAWGGVGEFMSQELRPVYYGWDGQSLQVLGGELGASVAIVARPSGVIAYRPDEVHSLGADGWLGPDGRPSHLALEPPPPLPPECLAFLAERGEIPPLPGTSEYSRYLRVFAKPTPPPERSADLPPLQFAHVPAAFDPVEGALVLGPGGWGSYGTHRHQFHVERGGQWRGFSAVHAEPPDVYRLVALAGETVAFISRALVRFDLERGWTELAQVPFRPSAAIEGPSGEVLAIGSKGVARIIGGDPVTLTVQSTSDEPSSIHEENDTIVGCDPVTQRIVMWNPKSNRHSGRAWLDGETWQTEISKGPHHDTDPSLPGRYELIADSGLRRLIRLSASEVAIFDRERWRTRAPDPILAAIHPSHRLAVHDSVTGETLVLDLAAKLIVRFDLARSTLVARYDWPQGLLAITNDRDRAPFPFGATCWNPGTRTLRTYSGSDAWGTYELALGVCFDTAAKMAPRTPADAVAWG